MKKTILLLLTYVFCLTACDEQKTTTKGKTTMTYKELIQSNQIINKSMKSKLSDKILTVSFPAYNEDPISFSFHQKRGFTEKDLYSIITWVFPTGFFSPFLAENNDKPITGETAPSIKPLHKIDGNIPEFERYCIYDGDKLILEKNIINL